MGLHNKDIQQQLLLASFYSLNKLRPTGINTCLRSCMFSSRAKIHFHIFLIPKVAPCPFQYAMQPRVVFWDQFFCVPRVAC